MRDGSPFLLAALLAGVAACRPAPVPPPDLAWAGLPVSGSLEHARQLGFTACIPGTNSMRCRRDAIMIAGVGPFNAAVDLARSDGRGGFGQLIAWHDRDQGAPYAVGRALAAQGWTLCRTGQYDRGDQEIYTRAGSPVRVSIDISYWSKRRVRVLPERGQPTGKCW